MASISPVSATTVVYFSSDSNNVIVFSCHSNLRTDLLAIARGGHVAGFKLKDFGQPATMSIYAAEPGSKEALRAVPGNRDTDSPASEAEDVQVIILNTLACRKVIVTECGARPSHFIGGHGSTHAAAAHEDSPLHLSAGHSTSEGKREIWVVVVDVIGRIAKIDDLVASFRKQPSELLLHFESAMICANAHLHIALRQPRASYFAIWVFAAATILSALKPNFFNSCFRGAEAPNDSIQTLCPSE